MSTASLGRSREYLVRDDLAKRGWVPIMRASSSKGAGDLLMGHVEHGGALVQVGSRSKTLGPTERTRLIAAAQLVRCQPILAIYTPRQPISYKTVTHQQPKHWPVWTP